MSDTELLKQMINDTPTGGTLSLDHGRIYEIEYQPEYGDNQTNLKVSRGITINGNGATLRKTAGPGRILTIGKSPSITMNALASQAIEPHSRGRTVTLSSELNNSLSVGDAILIKSTAGLGDQSYFFEFNQISEIDGLVVTLENFIRLPKEPALNYEIASIEDLIIRGVAVHDLKLDISTGGNQSLLGIWCDDIAIRDCRVTSNNSRTGDGIYLQYCHNVTATGNIARYIRRGFCFHGLDTASIHQNIVEGCKQAEAVGYGFIMEEPSGWVSLDDNQAIGCESGYQLQNLYYSQITNNLGAGNGKSSSHGNFQVKSPYHVDFVGNRGFGIANYQAANMRFYYDPSDGFSQDAYMLIDGNHTFGASPGRGIVGDFFTANRVETAVNKISIGTNMALDGEDFSNSEMI